MDGCRDAGMDGWMDGWIECIPAAFLLKHIGTNAYAQPISMAHLLHCSEGTYWRDDHPPPPGKHYSASSTDGIEPRSQTIPDKVDVFRGSPVHNLRVPSLVSHTEVVAIDVCALSSAWQFDGI